MEKYTQKQRTDAEHFLRSRPHQQQEDHIPDIIERQIEKWMDQEGITIEDTQQTYHNKMNHGEKKTDQSSLGELSKQMDKGRKPEGKDNQKESHISSSHGRGDKGQRLREGAKQKQKPGEITSPRENDKQKNKIGK